ncbi:MAG: zinc-binding dehydrogenase [Bryobacterales bacterium]|nr:zinc-binding dehydrogenase [Bryobacterales bacterium]
MRAWFLDSYDGVENLRLGDAPDPQPGPNQVLLRVRFAALNPADAFLAQAMYPAKPALPHVLGRDGVGDVIAVGTGVSNVRVGDTAGIIRCDVGVDIWGTLADKVVVSAASVAPPPSGWSLEQTAGAPLVYLTAWQALTQWSDPPAPPPAGSVLLVTGASGGVGTASVQLGKSMGLTIVALSRSTEKAEKLRAMGAEFVFNPADPNLRKSVMNAIAPGKVDIAVDNIGGALFNQIIAMLGQGGRISVVGRSAGEVPNFNTASLFFRRNRLGGVAVSDFTPEQGQAAWKEITARLNATGQKPIVDHVFAFEDVKKAFARLAEGPMGKVLVRVAPGSGSE